VIDRQLWLCFKVRPPREKIIVGWDLFFVGHAVLMRNLVLLTNQFLKN
jgi:hypothetical protein